MTWAGRDSNWARPIEAFYLKIFLVRIERRPGVSTPLVVEFGWPSWVPTPRIQRSLLQMQHWLGGVMISTLVDGEWKYVPNSHWLPIMGTVGTDTLSIYLQAQTDTTQVFAERTGTISFEPFLHLLPVLQPPGTRHFPLCLKKKKLKKTKKNSTTHRPTTFVFHPTRQLLLARGSVSALSSVLTALIRDLLYSNTSYPSGLIQAGLPRSVEIGYAIHSTKNKQQQPTHK